MADIKTKWLASLSDGSTAIEGDGVFIKVPGTLSPWLYLQAVLKNSGRHITGMRIQVEKPGEATRTYNLPSLKTRPDGKHEHWRHLRPRPPVSFDYFRACTAVMGPDGNYRNIEGQAIEIRAIYEDFIVSLFVDEREGNESWVVVHKKAD